MQQQLHTTHLEVVSDSDRLRIRHLHFQHLRQLNRLSVALVRRECTTPCGAVPMHCMDIMHVCHTLSDSGADWGLCCACRYGHNVWHSLMSILSAVVIDCLVLGIAIATACW